MLKARICLLAAKNEGAYGVDPTLTGGANSILAFNVRWKALGQEHDERLPAFPWFGNAGEAVVKGWHEVTFECEIAGAGAAGSAPAYGPLLKACAMSETLNAGVSAVYAPVSTGESSVYLKYFINGKVHIMAGAMGNVVCSFVKGKRPMFQFRFIGLYVIPADAAILTPTLTAFQTPLVVNQANTTPATFHSYAGKFSMFELDAGNVVVHRNVPNSEAIRVVDRKTAGRVKLESELVATKDWYSIMRAGTAGLMTVTHGTAAGNKVAVAAPLAQLKQSDMDEEDGLMMETLPFSCKPSGSGNDEFSITVT